MDFIVGLLLFKGYTIIYVIIDRLSKFRYFIPLMKDFNSITMVEAFIHNVVKLHGIPRSIVVDRDRTFMRKFGNIYSMLWELLWQCLWHTIHRRMHNQKL